MSEELLVKVQQLTLDSQVKERAYEYRIRSLRQMLYALVIVIVMELLLCASLWSMTTKARNNEGEMSRRLYQAVRQGHILQHTNNANLK